MWVSVKLSAGKHRHKTASQLVLHLHLHFETAIYQAFISERLNSRSFIIASCMPDKSRLQSAILSAVPQDIQSTISQCLGATWPPFPWPVHTNDRFFCRVVLELLAGSWCWIPGHTHFLPVVMCRRALVTKGHSIYRSFFLCSCFYRSFILHGFLVILSFNSTTHYFYQVADNVKRSARYEWCGCNLNSKKVV